MTADALSLALAELDGQQMQSVDAMHHAAKVLRWLARSLDAQADGLVAAGNAVVDARQTTSGRPKRRRLQAVP